MRDFYVYGFRSRGERFGRSARSYDDERRRIESWLGEYMRFSPSPEGKSVFLSIDTRAVSRNPFFKAWKSKSFTDGDITLHFILFDILRDDISLPLDELMERIFTDYLARFKEPMRFDDSTVRKKLKEYESEGIIKTEKRGKKVYYSRTEDFDPAPLRDVLDFFSEAAPCGAVGSFILDKLEPRASVFSFKHHYLTQTMDSDVLAELFAAMREHRAVSLDYGRWTSLTTEVVPQRVLMSAQNGRQHLLAFEHSSGKMLSLRMDFISNVKALDVSPDFDELRLRLCEMRKNMWGVSCSARSGQIDHVEFTIFAAPHEHHIRQRLEREKRCGTVEEIDGTHLRFSADILDITEIVPWIRTFTGRITDLSFSDKEIEERFRQDIRDMYAAYGLTAAAKQEGEET